MRTIVKMRTLHLLVRHTVHLPEQVPGRPRLPGVIVVNRFRVEQDASDGFRQRVQAALAALAARPGYVDGHVGRNVDEPSLWLLTTTWANVGSYRRALSSYDVKVTSVPLLSTALDEPSAYELVTTDESPLNETRPRHLG